MMMLCIVCVCTYYLRQSHLTVNSESIFQTRPAVQTITLISFPFLLRQDVLCTCSDTIHATHAWIHRWTAARCVQYVLSTSIIKRTFEIGFLTHYHSTFSNNSEPSCCPVACVRSRHSLWPTQSVASSVLIDRPLRDSTSHSELMPVARKRHTQSLVRHGTVLNLSLKILPANDKAFLPMASSILQYI